MEHIKFATMFMLMMMVGSSALAGDSAYLYSPYDIPVHETSSRRSKVIYTIKAGETIQIEKWNRNNTRILLPDGKTNGWIDKDFVMHLAPDNDPGFLPRPLSVVNTRDRAYAPNDGKTYSDYRNFGVSSEVVNSGDDDDASDDDINPQENDGGKEAVTAGATTDFMRNLGLVTWKEATRQRKRAKFLGGGYRSGNVSKGMCAQGAMDAAVKSGLCRVRPTASDAYHLYTTGAITKACPNLKASKSLDPYKAPGASIIVYKGYAGKIKHNYGHVEIKIPVTTELKRTMGKQGANLKVGEFMYCSDFCSPHPTKRATNSVVAIYSLK